MVVAVAVVVVVVVVVAVAQNRGKSLGRHLDSAAEIWWFGAPKLVIFQKRPFPGRPQWPKMPKLGSPLQISQAAAEPLFEYIAALAHLGELAGASKI